MRDSIKIIVWLPPMTDDQYCQCRFPERDRSDMDDSSNDFRDQYPVSPLTGAGFKITPIGMPQAGHAHDKHSVKNRRMYGRIAAYVLEFNPPACIVGHNRLLVNGVPAAVRAASRFLVHWVLSNGATAAARDAIDDAEIVITSATPTYLFKHSTEADARLTLAAFRSRSEALLNNRKEATVKEPAFSYPPKPDPRITAPNTYTSYIRQREYLIDAYVKTTDSSGSFCTPIEDSGVEISVQVEAARTLRIGTKLHSKWLRERGLDKAENWKSLASPSWADPYAEAFKLVRTILKLDQDFRKTQLRSTSFKSLNLSKLDAEMLAWHVKGNDRVIDHQHFSSMNQPHRSKAYSACRLRVLDRVLIDFSIPYETQKSLLDPQLDQLLVYPGEFKPDERVEPYIYSRLSIPAKLDELNGMIAVLLEQETARSRTAPTPS